MRRIAGRIRAFYGLAGLTAVVAVSGNLVEGETGAQEVLALVCAAGALSTLALAARESRRLRFLEGRFPNPGDVFSLQAHGLSSRERELVLEMLAGKSMKEISVDHGIRYSTVRNTFSSAYRKLHIAGRPELLVLGERYRVE